MSDIINNTMLYNYYYIIASLHVTLYYMYINVCVVCTTEERTL